MQDGMGGGALGGMRGGLGSRGVVGAPPIRANEGAAGAVAPMDPVSSAPSVSNPMPVDPAAASPSFGGGPVASPRQPAVRPGVMSPIPGATPQGMKVGGSPAASAESDILARFGMKPEAKPAAPAMPGAGLAMGGNMGQAKTAPGGDVRGSMGAKVPGTPGAPAPKPRVAPSPKA